MKTEEQLLRSKVKYLEDRVKVLDKAVGRINQILGRFQMTEATGFPRSAREFMQQDQGEVDNSYNITGKLY